MLCKIEGNQYFHLKKNSLSLNKDTLFRWQILGTAKRLLGLMRTPQNISVCTVFSKVDFLEYLVVMKNFPIFLHNNHQVVLHVVDSQPLRIDRE